MKGVDVFGGRVEQSVLGTKDRFPVDSVLDLPVRHDRELPIVQVLVGMRVIEGVDVEAEGDAVRLLQLALGNRFVETEVLHVSHAFKNKTFDGTKQYRHE